MSDAAAVTATLGGERDAFAVLVERHYSSVRAVCYAASGDPADGDDLTQEVFMKAFLSLDTLRDKSKFANWILIIARNLCRNAGRAKRALKRSAPVFHEQPIVPDPAKAELRELLRSEVEKLDETAREVLVLHYYAGKTAGEIAELLEISPDAAAKRLQRAREAISVRLLTVLREDEVKQEAEASAVSSIMRSIAIATPVWDLTAATASTAPLAHTTVETVQLTLGVLAVKKTAVAVVALLIALGAAWLGTRDTGNESTPLAGATSSRSTALTDADRDRGETGMDGADAVAAAQRAEGGTGGAVAHIEGSPAELTGGGVLNNVDMQRHGAKATPASNVGTGNNTAVKDEEKGNGALAGQITEPSGDVSDQARVVIVRAPSESTEWYAESIPGSMRETTSDANGRFQFQNLALGSYRVRAFKEGMSGVRSAILTERDPAPIIEMDIEPVGFIGGMVVDAAGKPIAGARVYPHQKRLEGYPFYGKWSAELGVTSDVNGAFLVEHLFEDDWMLCAQAKGFATIVTGYISLGTEDVTITMKAGGSASGTVVDVADDAPIPNQPLVIGSTTNGRDRRTVTTATDGTFRVEGLGEGEYVAVLDGNGYVNAGQPDPFSVADGDDTSGLKVEATRGGAISGRVYEAKSNVGISGIEISGYTEANVTGLPASGMGRFQAKSDSSGNYRIDGMPVGTVRVSVLADGYVREMITPEKRVVVQPGKETSGIDFPLDKGITIEGVVVDTNGRGVDAATVQSDDGRFNFQNTVSRPGGSFALSGLVPTTTLTLQATRAGIRSAKLGPLEVTDKGIDPITLMLIGGGSIAGRAVDTKGQPAQGVTVIAIQASTGQSLYGGTGPGGAFSFLGLMADTYAVFAVPGVEARPAAPPADARIENITLSESEVRTAVEIVVSALENSYSITGSVTDVNGKPIAGAMVQAMGGPAQPTFVKTDADGNYEIPHLTEGAYIVMADMGGYSREERRVDAGATVDFVLRGDGRVEGQVIARGGTPVKDFKIAPITGSLVQYTPDVMRFSTSYHDEEGRFTLEHVDAGPLTLVCSADGMAPAMEVIDVLPEETTSDVIIELEPGAAIAGIVVGPNGTPIHRAAITAFPSANPDTFIDASSFERQSLTHTDAEGMFAYNGLWNEPLIVVANANGMAPAAVTVTPGTAEALNLRLALGTGGTIAGNISVNGSVPSEAWVDVHAVQAPGVPRVNVHRNAHANAQGAFVVEGLIAGETEVIASIPLESNGSRSQTRTVMVEDGRSQEVHFDFLEHVAALECTVVNVPAGMLIEYASVEVAMEEGATEKVFRTPDPDGTFRFGAMPAGHAVIRAFARSGFEARSATADTDLADGETATVVLDFAG